jgi:hypothetical protein
MTLPRADGDLPIFAPSGSWSDNLWILASRPIKTYGEQFEDRGSDRRPTILALASGRRRGRRSLRRRRFEILLNLTFGRAPPSTGLPSKRRIWWP